MGFWETALAAGLGSLEAITVAALVGRFVSNLEVRRSAVGRLVIDAIAKMDQAAEENEERAKGLSEPGDDPNGR